MISRSMHFAQILPGRGAFFAHSAKKGCTRRDSCQPGPRCRRNARDGDAGGVRWAQCGWGARHDGRGADADGGAAGWARYGQGPNGTTPTMILDLLDTGTARREWRRGSAQAMGLSKRGRRNGAETEGHTGAWAQWSRAAQCRRCDEGQGSAEIAGRRGRRSGRGKRMDTVQEHGARWTRCTRTGGSYSLKCASITATRSFSASMSCWFTSSIFCKSAGEAFST